MRIGFLPQLRDERTGDALHEQRLERSKLGTFLLAPHRGTLSQLFAERRVQPRTRAIARDNSANHERFGQHRVFGPSNGLCRDQRVNVLAADDRSRFCGDTVRSNAHAKMSHGVLKLGDEPGR